MSNEQERKAYEKMILSLVSKMKANASNDKPVTATEIELAKEKAYENMVKWAKWLVENKKEDDDCPKEHWLFRD